VVCVCGVCGVCVVCVCVCGACVDVWGHVYMCVRVCERRVCVCL